MGEVEIQDDVIFSGLFGAPDVPVLSIITAIFVAIILYRYRRIIYITIVTLPRDIKFVSRWTKLVLKTRHFERDHVTVVSIFNDRATRQPNDVCFYYEDKMWTNKDVFEYSNRIAHMFMNAGYVHGDVVALCMDGRPEYVAIWLGLAQLGVITALINTNLRQQSLLHCLNVAKPRAIVFNNRLAAAFQEISTSIHVTVDLYQLGNKMDDTSRIKSLRHVLNYSLSHPPTLDLPLRNKDTLFYIYTSGTTGLPKAAVIPHARFLIVTLATTTIISLHRSDVMYNPLPLYHSAGGIIGVGPALIEGIPVVIKPKFSASSYFADCAKYKCTIGQYIGEMCRYILATPDRPTDVEHSLRMMIGNGLSSAIWEAFVQRFHVPQITELYGATEGNVNIVNLDNTVGAVGFLPRFLPLALGGIGIIRMNDETNEPVRADNGLCVVCDIDEAGMFVGVISSRNPSREYHGYVDRTASDKKIIGHVFRHGDRAFVSGDTMVMDEYGYLYFKDRTGDTYRWKGENVSTSEVEAAISRLASLMDTTVYGVEIPGQDGRAGMAAITDPDDLLDVADLATGLDRVLPTYARPLFLRKIQKMAMTGTFRMKKGELQKEGFDPNKIKDRMFFRSGEGYEPLTPKLYEEILSGEARV